MSTARDDVREALRSAISPADPTIDSLLDSMVEALLEKCGDGWLVMDGAIRRVEIADRFGVSSWEISTDENPVDVESWRTRYDAE